MIGLQIQRHNHSTLMGNDEVQMLRSNTKIFDINENIKVSTTCVGDLRNRIDVCIQCTWNTLWNDYKFYRSNEAKEKTKKYASYLPKQHKTSYPNSTLHHLCATMFAQTLSKLYPEIMLPKLEQGPTMFCDVTKPNGHWGAPIYYFPPKNPTTFLSILTRLIQIWIETTHFFIQVVKPIIILLILLHTFRGILCLW